MCCSSSLPVKTVFLLCALATNAVCERVVHSIGGTVGGGNFTHYSLKQEGTVTLILESKVGDADIYVSETNPKPDYLDYDLQSATCGQDVITIPKDYKRPIGIAIYGHVYQPVSKYVLTVILDYDGELKERDAYTGFFDGEEEAPESTLWVVFINIIKIILEVLV